MYFRFWRNSIVWLAVACLLAAAAKTHALEPATPLGRLARQSWSMENGLPQNTVPVLLQSHDGYLWAGTEVGLARFDGAGFRIFDHTTAALPDAEVRCVLDGMGKDGLWVGTADGLVRFVNERPTVLTTKDGLPSNSIRGLAQTADGTVWAWTELGLARWVGGRFHSMALEDVLGGAITSLAADGTDGLWVGTTQGTAVFREGHWHPGPGLQGKSRATPGPLATASLVAAVSGGEVLISTSEEIFSERGGVVTPVLGKALLPEDGVSFLNRLAGGTIAVASKSTVVLAQGGNLNGRVTGRFTVSKQLPGSRIETIFADREGCLWVGTNRGLARISIGKEGGVVQVLPPTDPLSLNAVVTFLEDREGDLWVGTETAGLHIFRDARFRTIGIADGLSSDATTAIVEDTHQTLWVGTRDSGLNRIANGNTTKLTTANGLLSDVILALAAGPMGDLWVGTPDGLSRIEPGGVTSFTSADGLPDDFIRSLLVAPDDSAWIGTRRGLTHLDHGRFQNFTQADGLGSDLVGAMARTVDGDLWIATLNGLTRMHQGQLHNYTVADGLSSNVITALDVTPNGMIWIGTQGDGLNLWDGKRFVPVRDSSNLQSIPAAIHGVLHDNLDHLWIASDSGLTRIDLKGLLDCVQDRGCRLNATHFTTADGLRSRETSNNSHPTVCRAHDGQLWFTTPRGIIVVDPLHFAALPDSPPVAIERFAVDDQDQDANQIARITAGHMRFQFDYAGLSFAAPQKLRYQYMLEGFDRGWTDAGTRRTAYYTNISPGKYRFRVRAMFGDSRSAYQTDISGNPAGAALSFELLPHFYQTVWFRALLIAVVAGLVLFVFRRRVLRVEREFRAVMGERNRIAREIHDTLAQGYVGISLQLEILGQLLRHNRTDAAAKHLTLTQELVREGLDDARQSIWALRSQDAGEQTLPIRMRRLVEQAQDRELTADLDVHGAYRALSPDAEKEILRIAQEAIQNVKRHAAASHLNVRLEYGERVLALTVSDDGKGFTAPLEASSGKANGTEGHYGLTGMRERSELIHGEILITSAPGKGTTVNLSVPAPELSTRNRGNRSVASIGHAPTDNSKIEPLSTTASDATLSETTKEQL